MIKLIDYFMQKNSLINILKKVLNCKQIFTNMSETNEFFILVDLIMKIIP